MRGSPLSAMATFKKSFNETAERRAKQTREGGDSGQRRRRKRMGGGEAKKWPAKTHRRISDVTF